MQYGVRRRKSHKPKILLVALVLLVLALLVWYFNRDKAVAPSTEVDQTSQVSPNLEQPKTTNWQPVSGSMQQLIEEFASSHKGTYSIVVIHPETGVELANYNGDEDNFAASLYKLWVAYEGYRKVDDGTYDFSESYLSGWTREKCLDEMIRSSHSPCAEKMWAELGREYLSEKVKEYGAKDTDMVGLRTNAADVAQILKRIANGEGLSSESKAKYLDSMLTQDAKYRRGLPTGFGDSVKAHNKVGWNELVEWHDAAIVDFGDDKRLVVVALTNNAGASSVAALAKVIETNLPN